MKRLWFAVAFLILAAVLCVSEQYYIKDFYQEIDKKITAAEMAAVEGDKEKLDKDIGKLKKYWKKNNNLIFILAEHDVPNELGECIRAINPEEEDILSSLAEIRALNEVFFENQKITFANVF